MFKWVEGRQGSGYEKLRLLYLGFFDIYLLRYKPNSYIETHTDPVPRGRHFRLNLVLTSSEGGNFVCPNAYLNKSRIKFFRPDIHEHSVTQVESGTRYVFSFGWLLP